jgi:hypothetical protein
MDVGDAIAFGVAPAWAWCVGQVDSEASCGGQSGAFPDEDGNLFCGKQLTDFVAEGDAGLFGDDDGCDLTAGRPQRAVRQVEDRQCMPVRCNRRESGLEPRRSVTAAIGLPRRG